MRVWQLTLTYVFAFTPVAVASAQGSLCNPCIDPSIGGPGRSYGEAVGTRNITAEDLRALGLISAADMLSQGEIRPEGEQPFRVGETLSRLRLVQTAPAAPASSSPLVHETVVAAPLESVWRAWSTSAGLSAWLAPLVDIDLRIGGTLRVAIFIGNNAEEHELGPQSGVVFEPGENHSVRALDQDLVFVAFLHGASHWH
jgi:hypothetical protein